MKWAETESAARKYLGYFDQVLTMGRVEIPTPKADSLAHVLRYILKGFKKRNHLPYCTLTGRCIVQVKDGKVVIEKQSLEVLENVALDTKEIRITAPSSFSAVLEAIARMKAGLVARVAFLMVSDLDAEKTVELETICANEKLACSINGKTVVVVK